MAGALPDERGRLETVDPRHAEIHEDAGEFRLEHALESFRAGIGKNGVIA